MHDIQLMVISSAITLVSTLIGFFAQTLFNFFSSNRGKVKLYVKSVYAKETGNAWGFHSSEQGILFSVPLWLEIHNTKSKKQIIRNFNLVLFNNGKNVGKTMQISYYNKMGNPIHYGDGGTYSFLLDAHEIKRFDLFFAVLQKDIDMEFDEVKVSYYDSKDNYHEYKLLEISQPWQISNNKIDDDWRLLK